jgi:biotin carboxylase
MDVNPQAPGVGLADIFEPVDLKDRKTLLQRARFYRAHGGLDGVFTAGTDFSLSVAYIAEKLGLPGLPVETALNATDKSRMREIFKKHGIPSPAWVSFTAADIADLSNPSGAEGAASAPGAVKTANLLRFPGNYPVVVKPVDNMGARGVRMVESPAGLPAALHSALLFSGSGKAIVEEFIEGPEFSIDALVYKGKISTCGMADRHIYFPPFFVELGHTFPSAAPAKVLAEVEDVFRRGVEALGITDGAAKGDIFSTPHGAVVGEIAARLSGGYMSGWTCPYARGVDITEEAMNIAMGIAPAPLEAKRSWTSAERAFISIPGAAEEITGIETALDIPGVQDIFTRIEPGSPLKFPENNVEKCGNIISALPGHEAAVKAAEKAVSCILVRLAPQNPETQNYLFAPAPLKPPAYTLPQEILRPLQKLPQWVKLADVIPHHSDSQGGQAPPAPASSGLSPLRGPALPPMRGYHPRNAPASTGSQTPFFAAGNILILCAENTLEHTEIHEITDWNHREFRASLEEICRIRETQKPPPWAGALALGSVFWQAFIRGSVQGGLWVLDTLSRKNTVEEVQTQTAAWESSSSF